MVKLNDTNKINQKLNEILIVSRDASCTVATALKLENWTDLV